MQDSRAPGGPPADDDSLPSGAPDVEDEDSLEDMLGATSTIGRAVESLKGRLGLDDEEAFTHLVQLAEDCQIRLRDAAASVVSEGDETDRPESGREAES